MTTLSAEADLELAVDEARLLCTLGKYPISRGDLADDMRMERGEVRSILSSLRRQGWPIMGGAASGYTIHLEDGCCNRAMRELLEDWGNRLYGGRTARMDCDA